KHGTLPLAIVSIAFGAVNLIFSLIVRIIAMMLNSLTGGLELFLSGFAIITPSIEFGPPNLVGPLIFSFLITLFLFAEWIIFPLFLRAIAVARARWVVGNCIGIVIFAGVIALFQIVAIVLFYVSIKSPMSKGVLVTAFIISMISYL